MMTVNTATETGSADQAARPKRRRELDVMGVAIVFWLVFFHTATIFSGQQWVVNESQSEAATIVFLVVVSFAALWTMPLMMLIAGMTVSYSLRRRTTGEFVRERIKRLFVPFLTGLVLIIPIEMYYAKLDSMSQGTTYWQFYPRFWNVRFSLSAFPVFLKGTPPDEFFQVSILWFLIALFVYTLLLLPLFVYLRKPAGRRLVERLATFFAHLWAIFLLGLPIALVEGLLTTDWGGAWNRFVWVFLITYGFLFASDDRFSTTLERHRKIALVLGIVGYLAYFMGVGMLAQVTQANAFTDYDLGSIIVRFIKGLASWFWVVAIMGIATYRSRRGAQEQQAEETARKPTLVDRILAYAREAQLPFYMLHQLPIIVIGYYVVQWNVGAFVKFLVISLSSLVIVLVLYDIVVRRTPVTRFLFGMRPKRGGSS